MTDVHHPDPIGQRLPPDAISSVVTFSAWLVLGCLIAIVVIDGILLQLWRGGYGPTLVREYGVVESLQSLLLAVSFLFFWMSWRESDGPARTASCALMILAAAMFVRELDVKKFNGPDWYNWIAQRGLQEILLVGMTVPILIYLVRHWRQWIDLIRMGLRPAALPLYIAGAFILAGAYLDARVHGWADKMFWEEFSELNGYLFLGLAAYLHLKIVRSTSNRAS
ncbi:hypothetical protein ACO2I3_08210 [Leptospira interrogans]